MFAALKNGNFFSVRFSPKPSQNQAQDAGWNLIYNKIINLT